ncbi:hypothetical protein AOLI_G00330350 [Acnodon oligacanthus]
MTGPSSDTGGRIGSFPVVSASRALRPSPQVAPAAIARNPDGRRREERPASRGSQFSSSLPTRQRPPHVSGVGRKSARLLCRTVPITKVHRYPRVTPIPAFPTAYGRCAPGKALPPGSAVSAYTTVHRRFESVASPGSVRAARNLDRDPPSGLLSSGEMTR